MCGFVNVGVNKKHPQRGGQPRQMSGRDSLQNKNETNCLINVLATSHTGVANGDRTRDKGTTSLCVTTTPWPPHCGCFISGISIAAYSVFVNAMSSTLPYTLLVSLPKQTDMNIQGAYRTFRYIS